MNDIHEEMRAGVLIMSGDVPPAVEAFFRDHWQPLGVEVVTRPTPAPDPAATGQGEEA
ncbi:MAG: hypothetical protein JWO74_3147 [Solirubrobacterales bacterium]|nr:hypothetical protein [Solirubrobacterales bacterium]